MGMQTDCIYQLGINKSATLVPKDPHNGNHPVKVKKVLLRNTIQLPSYIKIDFSNGYYYGRIGSYERKLAAVAKLD